jgi:hypothetical protein
MLRLIRLSKILKRIKGTTKSAGTRTSTFSSSKKLHKVEVPKAVIVLQVLKPIPPDPNRIVAVVVIVDKAD